MGSGGNAASLHDKSGILENWLKSQGININRPFKCLNPAHDDGRPSMHYWKRGGRVKCFGCGALYDIYDIIGIEYGLDINGQFKQIKRIAEGLNNGPIREGYSYSTGPKAGTQEKPNLNFIEYYRKCNADIILTDYVQRRGISEGTSNKYKIGFDVLTQCVVIPVARDFYVERSVIGERKWSHGNTALFNKRFALESGGPIFIVEGAFDALSIIEAGFQAIALNSVSNWRLLNGLPDDRHLIILMDADKAGKAASAKIAQSIAQAEVIEKKFYPDGIKDVNEFWQADADELRKRLEELT